jgi:hypothetical protein
MNYLTFPLIIGSRHHKKNLTFLSRFFPCEEKISKDRIYGNFGNKMAFPGIDYRYPFW